MARRRLFPDDARLELIGGEVVRMPPPSAEHDAITNRITALFARRFDAVATTRSQSVLLLASDTLVVPDVAIVRLRTDFYVDAYPSAADALLVVEVARSTLRLDRRVKLPRYAAAGVPEVWIVAVAHDAVLAYSDPTPDGYATQRTLARAAALSPAAVPDVVMTVDDLIGPPRPRRRRAPGT